MKTIIRFGVLGLALCQAVPASAAGLNVSPVQVHLSAREAKSQITVRNEGTETSRYQVSLFSWTEDPEKGMQLVPSQDLVFFPALLTLAPGEARVVRLGVPVERFGALEKTYRVFVEELPPAERPAAQSTQVRVLTRIGMPIFLAPLKAVEQRSIAVSLGGKGVLADVRNGGNVHLRLQDVELHAIDERGNSLFATRQQGWYVLANSHKTFDFEVPAGVCAKARKVAVLAHTDDDKAFSGTAEAPRGVCRR